LISQRNVDLRIVVVDNASESASRAAMEEVFRQKLPGGIVVDVDDATSILLETSSALFIRNSYNSGYSVGNNIGARLAVGAGCKAVLILNPDVRVADSNYMADLWSQMQIFPNCVVASSRVIDLAGHDEHPLRETGFWEELLWVRQVGPRMFRPAPKVAAPNGTKPVEAEKLHGSCLMFRASFLTATKPFDERVFLYSEEPILAARVRTSGGKMMVFPKLEAIHAHVASTKGDPSKRMLQFIESRRLYIDSYTNYGPLRKAALHTSYGILSLLHKMKIRLGKR
jgi:GT2 family glycosyltransferase